MTGSFDTIQDVRIIGDPVLKQVAAPVMDFGGELADLAESMVDSMFAGQRGIGLAAPQVGVSSRIVVIDRSLGEEYDDILTMVNPEILEADGSVSLEEGCLSVPGIYADVTRPEAVRARYFDIHGNAHIIENDEFLARVIQHEIDHLEGVLFVERLSAIKRKLIGRQLRELTENGSIG